MRASILLTTIVLFSTVLRGFAGESRVTALAHEAHLFQRASRVTADEFVGFQASKHNALTTVSLSKSQVAELVLLLQGKELAREVPVRDAYRCFTPHHSFRFRERDGTIHELQVCLQCHAIQFQHSNKGKYFPLTAAATQQFKEFFLKLGIPVPKSEEYGKEEQKAAEKTK